MKKNAVILIGPGFEDSEFLYPYYRLQEAGFAVDVASTSNELVKGKHGVPHQPNILLSNLDAEHYDLAVIPGGHESPDRVRQVPEVMTLLKNMHAKGKAISSVCHGPWVMISAGIMKGKKATCYKGMKDDLINAGAEYLDEDVVVDGNLITSPHFRNNHQWMQKTLEFFK